MTDESIFAAALAFLSPAQRTAFLDHACAGNAALRREGEELLAAHAPAWETGNPTRAERKR